MAGLAAAQTSGGSEFHAAGPASSPNLVRSYGVTYCIFELTGGLGSTYTLHLRLFGKLVLDFLFMLIDLFLLGVTAEALRAKIQGAPAKVRPTYIFDGNI